MSKKYSVYLRLYTNYRENINTIEIKQLIANKNNDKNSSITRYFDIYFFLNYHSTTRFFKGLPYSLF